MALRKKELSQLDKLVVEKTGKTMSVWFKSPDKKGAKELKYKDIFNLVGRMRRLNQTVEWNQDLFRIG